MKYWVYYDDGVVKERIPHLRPEILAQPGDVYVWKRAGHTIGGHTYVTGDIMRIVCRTEDAPFHRKADIGNLYVDTKYGRSVWTCIDHLIAEGDLELFLQDLTS